jgi:predicted Fe-Mo cluster-binding NifX family protein
MRIAVATDRDCVASGFGCCPFCTIVEIEDGRVHSTLLIPNPGAKHEYWADFFFRNSIHVIIAGSMGATARSIMLGSGIRPVLGVKGPIDTAVQRFLAGEIGADSSPGAVRLDDDGCCHRAH